MGRSQPVRANDFIIAVVRLLEPCGPQPPAAEARKRAPQAAPEIPNEMDATPFAAKPLFRTLRRIHPSDCFSAPATGYRHESTGDLTYVGLHLGYWSSSSFGAGSDHASWLRYFDGDLTPMHGWHRSCSFSVRCVQASARLLLPTGFRAVPDPLVPRCSVSGSLSGYALLQARAPEVRSC